MESIIDNLRVFYMQGDPGHVAGAGRVRGSVRQPLAVGPNTEAIEQAVRGVRICGKLRG